MALKCNEGMITQALRQMHSSKKMPDIFASQVKLGQAGSKILDAIAIKTTWSPRTITGYEIKVSRNDFLNDQKHPVYMETCHLFYFVAPKGIVDKSELPESVGLLEFNPNAKCRKFRTVKKAAYRNIDINPDMLLHVIFWKMEKYTRPKTKDEHLKDIQGKIESRSYGHQLAEKLNRMERQIEHLKAKKGIGEWDKIYNEVRKITGHWDITPDYVIKLIKENGVPTDKLKRLKNSLDRMSRDLNQLMKEGDKLEQNNIG